MPWLTILSVLSSLASVVGARTAQKPIAASIAKNLPKLAKFGKRIEGGRGGGLAKLIGQELFVDTPASIAGYMGADYVANKFRNSHAEGVMDMSKVAARDPVGIPATDLERVFNDLMILDPSIQDSLLQVTTPQQQQALRLI